MTFAPGNLVTLLGGKEIYLVLAVKFTQRAELILIDYPSSFHHQNVRYVFASHFLLWEK